MRPHDMSWARHSHSPVRERSPDIPLDGVMQDAAYLLRRIPLPRTRVNRAGAMTLWLMSSNWRLLYRSASAAHTARPSARLSASKTAGLPEVGVSCALTDTVTERLPLGLAAANWV